MRQPFRLNWSTDQILRVSACLTGVGVLVCAATARAELRIESETPHAAMWRRVYDELPNIWKSTRVVVVHEVSNEEMERLVSTTEDGSTSHANDNTVVDGCFQPGERDDDTDMITLRETLHGQDAELVFTHEYGHFVWDVRMTRAQRDQYRRLWRFRKQQGRMVTEYARDSPEEGFAEAFAYFLRKSATLYHKDPDSWRFLNDLLPEKQRFSAP